MFSHRIFAAQHPDAFLVKGISGDRILIYDKNTAIFTDLEA